MTPSNITFKRESRKKKKSWQWRQQPFKILIIMEGRYEVVGFGLENRTELKGKRFDTVDEII